MALALAGALGACGRSSDTGTVASDSTTTGAPPGGTMAGGTTGTTAVAGNGAVAVKDFSFKPDPVTVKAGTTVTWTNGDSADHAIVDDGSAFTGGAFGQGKTYTHVYATAGTFKYHCGIHNYMTGKVVVQ